MDPIGLRARREALGLSQRDFARHVGNAQNTVSQWEAGKRAIPADIEPALVDLEDRVHHVMDTICEKLDTDTRSPIVLPTYARDESFWAAHPEMDPTPAAIHRVACARVAAEIHAEDPTTTIHIRAHT